MSKRSFPVAVRNIHLCVGSPRRSDFCPVSLAMREQDPERGQWEIFEGAGYQAQTPEGERVVLPLHVQQLIIWIDLDARWPLVDQVSFIATVDRGGS